MATTLELQGLDDLRAALRRLPEDLAREADVIVFAHASEAARGIQSGYPIGPTGNLQRGVTQAQNRSTFGVSALVRSRAKHASIFESGSAQRRTAKGFNRGRMPQPTEAQRMIPKVVRARARMMAALMTLVRSQGFEVTT